MPRRVLRYKKVFYGLWIRFILYLVWHPVLEGVNQFVSKMFAKETRLHIQMREKDSARAAQK